MPNFNIKSSEYAWHHCEVKVFGRVIRGITGFEFKKSTDKEALYGAGQHAIDIQEGNISCSGSMNVFGYEKDRMDAAARVAGYDDITAVPHEAIVITALFRKLAKDPLTKIVATGVAFTETTDAMQQNDSKRDCELPFICMDIQKTTLQIG